MLYQDSELCAMSLKQPSNISCGWSHSRYFQQVVLRQERERLRIERFERERLSMQASTDGSIEHPQYDRDMNNVGLPSPSQYSPDSLSQQFRYMVLLPQIHI